MIQDVAEPVLETLDRAIVFEDGAVQIDAAIVAAELGLAPADVPALLRAGAITSVCERGAGEDAGRHRLTFFFANRRCRLVVDAEGRIIQRSSIDFGDRPLPAALHRPGD
jgi:hypothetical protein